MKSLLIAGKDVKILLKDRRAMLMLIVMPIILTAILGSALKGVMGGGGMPETLLGVYSAGSSALTDNILHSLEDEALAITVERADSEKQLHEWMENGQVDVGVHIPRAGGIKRPRSFYRFLDMNPKRQSSGRSLTHMPKQRMPSQFQQNCS